ncbi:proteasome subunit alpha [Nitrospira sp.]|nr:proteasome subunit alpha [Nitrospira sp.]
MYEEPYRWVEAVGNRRQYLDEQFRQGSPVVALSFGEGVLFMTVSKGTPKLYEIYDRIGLGGMGHPADLEKLRFSLLEMAHLEGFNRSPSDVTGSRLMKYGLAPAIKQAFEEIYKAPYIVKMLLAELGSKSGRDAFLTVNYDGTFEEVGGGAVLAATPAIQREMMDVLSTQGSLADAELSQAFEAALLLWAVGSLRQRREDHIGVSESPEAGAASSAFDRRTLLAHLREVLNDRTNVECAVLERKLPGSSKYRSVKPDEAASLLPLDLKD